MDSSTLTQISPLSLGTLSELQSNWFDRLFFLLLIFFAVASNLHLRHRRQAKFTGCQASRRRAPVKDPFIGLDFIYERLFRGAPAKNLAGCFQDFRALGSTYVVSRWTTRTVHTCDARNIKHILASGFEDFGLPGVRVSVLSELLGRGVFTLDGRAWYYTRALLRPTLTKSKMDLFPDILERHVQSLLGNIRAGGSTQDLQPLFFKVTMDVASDFLLGHSTNMLAAATDGSPTPTSQFVDDYMICSTEAVEKMCLGPLSFLRFNSAADRARDRVFAYMDDYIHESLQYGRQGEGNFLQELAGVLGDGKALRDQVLHIFLASRDTTASLLSNLFFVLTKKPEVYGKLREEVLGVVGQGGVLPTFEQLKSMTYLKWCINESLRLHPVVPSNAREAVQDTTLPYGGGEDGNAPLLVSKGTVVLYNVHSMHRDENVFGDDVDEFRPERWEGLRPGWGYLPFNGGPRICIGQQFALLETYYIVARMVQTFARMESRDDSQWEELSALAATCKNGVHVGLYTG